MRRRIPARSRRISDDWRPRIDPHEPGHAHRLIELIARLAPNPWTREEILTNPMYGHLSAAVAGSQEYTAIAKLFEIEREGGYEVIVLDTLPSRNAIDFLEAPGRLIGFLEGGALKAFLRPTRRVIRAAGVVFAALRRITGVGLLEDLTTFFGLASGLLDGFRSRAADVQALLTDPTAAFLVVTSPERAPLDEAIFFAGELVVHPASSRPVRGVLPLVSKSLLTSSARMEADDGCEGRRQAGRGV